MAPGITGISIFVGGVRSSNWRGLGFHIVWKLNNFLQRDGYWASEPYVIQSMNRERRRRIPTRRIDNSWTQTDIHNVWEAFEKAWELAEQDDIPYVVKIVSPHKADQRAKYYEYIKYEFEWVAARRLKTSLEREDGPKNSKICMSRTSGTIQVSSPNRQAKGFRSSSAWPRLSRRGHPFSVAATTRRWVTGRKTARWVSQCQRKSHPILVSSRKMSRPQTVA